MRLLIIALLALLPACATPNYSALSFDQRMQVLDHMQWHPAPVPVYQMAPATTQMQTSCYRMGMYLNCSTR